MSSREHHNLKVLALTSLRAFCDLIKFHGGAQNFGQVHLELMDWLATSKGVDGTNRLLLMPRSHLKSTIVSQLYVLWRIYVNPNIRIYLDCNSLPLSKKHLRIVDAYLRDADLQKTVWNARPHFTGPLVPNLELSGIRVSRQKSDQMDESVIRKVIWNAISKQVIRTKLIAEPTVTCGSLGSAVTGHHYDLVIYDDLVDRKNSKTESLRDKIEDHIAELASVVDPWNPEEEFGQEILMLGTCYYREDAYAKRRNDPEWQVFERNIYANGTDFSDGTLWPERFTQTYLTRKKNTFIRQGKSKEWYSQYLNKIIDDEHSTFKRESFRYFDPRSLVRTSRGWELRRTGGIPPIWLRPVLMVDWAFKPSERSDFIAVVVIALDAKGRVFVLDAHIVKALPSSVYAKILGMAAYWQVITIGMESIRAWEAIQGFRKYMNDKAFNNGRIWPIVEVATKAEKITKIVTTLEPYYSSGRIIHSKTLHGGLLEQQLEYFPDDKDDGPDSLAMAVQLALRPKSNKPKPRSPAMKSVIQSLIGGIR